MLDYVQIILFMYGRETLVFIPKVRACCEPWAAVNIQENTDYNSYSVRMPYSRSSVLRRVYRLMGSPPRYLAISWPAVLCVLI